MNNIILFLNELKINNNRTWFADNKSWYDKVRLEFEQFAAKLIVEISKFDEDIKNVDVKDCVFRIYRDTRFANDKTPYKTHFGVYIASAGGRKSKRAGYYLHLDPDGSFLGSGVWCPEPNVLKALRQSVYDNIEEFNSIRFNPSFEQYFTSFLDNDKLKTVPRGFPKDFEFAELLKLKHYLVDYKLSPEMLNSDDLLNQITHVFSLAHPFNSFLNYTVDEVE